MSLNVRARRGARRPHRVAMLAVVALGLAALPGAAAMTSAGAEDAPPPVVHTQQTPKEVEIARPSDMLPPERGHLQDGYLDPAGLVPPIPDASLLASLDATSLLPNALAAVPKIDVNDLVGGVTKLLPQVDTNAVTQRVTGLVDELTGQVKGVTASAAGVARVLATTAAEAPRSRAEAAEDPTQTVTFRLSTSSNGVNQTFTIPLCTPTPVNVTSTSPLPATTIVSLCPVPLGVTGTPIVPPAGQPAQLYLSVNRVPGSPAVPATFRASYTVTDPNSGASLTIRFGLDSSSQAYPDSAIVGAATDYNPVPTPDTVPKQAVINVTTSWSLSSGADSIGVEAVGVGSVSLTAIPGSNGSFAIAVQHDKASFHLLSMSPFPLTSNTSIVVTRPLTSAPGNVTSASLVWSKLPQEFLFNLGITQVDGQPSGITFDGSQNMTPNPGFTVGFDYQKNGVLAGRYQQAGFGPQLATSVTLDRDQTSNITGVTVQSTPGRVSTAVLTAYTNGALANLVELGAMPADTSEVSVQLHGTVRDANAGVTISGTNAAPYIGVASYALPGGAVSATPVGSMLLTRGGTPAGLPYLVADGSSMALNVRDVAKTFKVNIQASGAAGAVTGVEVSGSTPETRTARQVTLRAASDATHSALLLMNQLGDQWAFKMNLHGTAAAPTGLDVSDVNATATPTEYKQLVVLTNGVVTHSLVVQRPGSDLTGALAPGGIVGTIYDPPATFDLSIDYAAPNVSGIHCTQGLRLQGRDAAASNGYVVLQANGITVDVRRPFVQGDWSVGVNASGPAINCTPDTITFDMHQGIGPNPAGTITATAAGAGQIVLKSFATTQKVTVKLLPDTAGNPSGARVDGTNSEANPGMELHLDQLNGAEVKSALNIFAGATGPVTYGTVTAILANTPQNFGISIQKTTDPTTKAETAEINSYNQATAPNETLTILAPAGNALPGGRLQLVLRSLDVASLLKITVWPPANGSMHARLQSQNANPNLTEVISAALIDAGGVPQYNVLFHRPNGNLAGVPIGATKALATWEKMPQSFDLDLNLAANGADRVFNLAIKNSQENPAGDLRLLQPQQNLGIVFAGTGASQSFELKFATAGQATMQLDASMSPSVSYVQAYRLTGGHDEIVLNVYGANANRYPEFGDRQRGTAVYITPPANLKTYHLEVGAQGKSTSFVAGGDVRGNRINVSQYFQIGDHQPCIWSGSYYPCTSVSLYDMPVDAHLTMALGEKDNLAPTVDYKASDSGMDIYVDALIPKLGGYMRFTDMPASGVEFTAQLVPGSAGIAATLASTDPRVPLGYFYIYGWNIQLKLDMDPTFTEDLEDVGGTLSGALHIHMNYNAYVTIQGDAGLTRVIISSPHGKNNAWDGLLGFKVDGNPNAQFNLGLTLDLNPGGHEIAWNWQLDMPFNFSSSDSDRFTWYNGSPYPVGYSSVGLTSYAWEARDPNHRYSGYGCSDLNTTPPEVDDAATHDWGAPMPFTPGFVPVNNGAVVCGGHTAYYQLNIGDLLFKHNGAFGPDLGGDVWSYASFGWPLNEMSDWMMAAGMKGLYTPDPANHFAIPHTVA
ncbi:MAG TPA: hypothetical protein VF519_00165 [Mycobacteriales bacterium]|jgi:hypothetical protein